jgi:transcriptional regulator with XRE-family HTH domain
MSILGENIKKIRTQKKLSMNKLARLSGLGVSTISEIESGKRNSLSIQSIQKIAGTLNTSVEELLATEEGTYEVTDLLDAVAFILQDEELSINGKAMSKEEKEQFRFAAEMAVNTIISNSK